MTLFLQLLSSSFEAIHDWWGEIGTNTIGVNILDLMVAATCFSAILRLLVLPAVFGSGGSDKSHKKGGG